MIQLLYSVIGGEMLLILFLLFKTPLRKLIIIGLDRVKRGRGPVMVKTIAGTVFAVLLSSVYTMTKIQSTWMDSGVINPTDQILMSQHMLEASLMGFSLFLALMIDRLHHYIRELRLLRKTMEAVKKQNRIAEDGKSASPEDVKALEEELSSFKVKVKQLESDYVKRAKELEAAEANASALRKQSEGFLLEYDRLLEDNQNLRNQLQSMDHMIAHSDTKKSP